MSEKMIEKDGIFYYPLEKTDIYKEGVYPSETPVFETGCGKMYVTITYKDATKKDILWVNTSFGKSGTCASALLSTICELLVAIQALPMNLKVATLVRASGHLCQYGRNCCGNILVREVIDTILKKEA